MKKEASLRVPVCRGYYVKRCGSLRLERGVLHFIYVQGRVIQLFTPYMLDEEQQQ